MTEVVLPEFTEDMEEGTIKQWFFEEGDAVEKGENLAEIQTEDGDFQVPSPVSGTLDEIFFEEGDDVEVGEVLATIEPE